MEEKLNQAQRMEESRQIRLLTQTEGWRILEERWLKLLRQKETVLKSHLRNPLEASLNDAIKMQGQADGIQLCLSEVERLMRHPEDESNPIY